MNRRDEFQGRELVIISGASAVGKDSQCELLKERDDYNFVISHSTRPMRLNESEGNPYHFVTKEEFDKIDFVETRSYDTLLNDIPDTWFYGVAKSALEDDKSYVVVLDLQGTQEFIEYFGDRCCPIYLHIDDVTRYKRSIARGSHSETEWNRRLKDDAKKFNAKDVSETYFTTIESSDIESTYNNIKVVIEHWLDSKR